MSAKKKVLVIDNDRDAGELIANVLGPGGFEVFRFADPDEGVAKAGEIGPDLVFISILFPGSNGLKISKAVHSIGGLQGVPVIMLISYPDELDPRYTSTIGIVDVALKPLSAEEILSKTVSVLGEGTAQTETEEISPGLPVMGEAEAASLDEEWMSFLDKDDAGSVEPEAPVREPECETEEGGAAKGGADEPAEGHAEEVHDAGDAAGDFLLAEEEEKPEPADEEGAEYAAAPQRRPVKKFFIITAALIVIIAGAAAGAYLFFQGQGGKIVTPVAKTPLKKVPAAAAKQNAVPAEKQAAPTQPVAVEATAAPSAPEKSAENKAPAVAAKVKKENYSVQVGAFHNGKNAAALIGKLKKKGYDAFVLSDAGGLNRVLIGKFDSRDAAAVEAKRVLEREGLKSIIFRY